MKKIWLINQNSMPPEYGHFNRQYNFGKYLNLSGNVASVFVGSYIHNNNIQVINDKEIISEYKNAGFPFYFIRTIDYSGNKIKRVVAMFEFYHNMMKAAKNFEKPDIIIGSSPHPLACLLAIRLAKKMKCKSLVEIRDLWPESIVAYKLFKKSNILVKMLYILEKYIYTKADKVIFTMEGGKDYIIKKGWDSGNNGSIDLNKVYYLNNGVDLEAFEKNAKEYVYEDTDLDDSNNFKVVYAGSLGLVNNSSLIIESAKYVLNNSSQKIKFIIYGDGAEKERLMKKVEDESISNVIFKGKVTKQFIPSILRKADINLLNFDVNIIQQYGSSQNKCFDYLAAGKPILSTYKTGYDIIEKHKAGISVVEQTPENVGKAVIEFSKMEKSKYMEYAQNAANAAKEYDFKVLSAKLIEIISN